MTAAALTQVVGVLQAAGLQLVVTPQRELKVTPAELLTPHLRDVIRGNREQLINWVGAGAANDVQNWETLDRAYQQHHFSCARCIAAGRGPRYGLRCGVGAALWRVYAQASSDASFSQTAGRNLQNQHNRLSRR